MAAVYTVQSYFFNVQAGDGAIHRLFLNGTAISTILMDAGKGGDSRIRPLRNFIVNNRIVFDAVVITHWDSDHYVGLYNLLVEDHANEGGTRAEKWTASSSEYKDWYPSFFKFSAASKTPGTTFYCPYFGKANKPKGKGDLKDSYTNFVTPDDGVTMQVKIGGAASNAIARICPTSILGADFFNWYDPIPTVSPTKFTSPSSLVNWHKQHTTWQTSMYAGAPGFYCLAQNWDLIGPPPGIDVLDTESSTYTNQSSIAALLMWPSGQLSLYTAGDRDDPREIPIVKWVGAYGGPTLGDNVTTIKAGHHGAATSTATSVLERFNPQNVIVSAGTDYGHPRWEFIHFVDVWNGRNLQAKSSTAHEYRDFRAPVASTVFPYWLAKDKNGDWVVLSLNKMGTAAFDDDKFDDFNTNVAAILDEINDIMASKGKPTTGYGAFASEVDLLTKYQAAIKTDSSRFNKIQEISGSCSEIWGRLSYTRTASYPEMSSEKGWVYGSTAQAMGRRGKSIAYIQVTSQEPWYADGSMLAVHDDTSATWYRSNVFRPKPSAEVAAPPSEPVRVTAAEAPLPRFPVFPSRPRGAFPSLGSAIVPADLYDDPNVDSDEQSNLTGSGNPMPQRLPPTYPTLAWPLGMYFYSMGGLKPTGPNVTVAIECATTSALGYFLPGLHSQLLGVSSTPDADGLYSVLADDELPNWFNAVLGPMPDLNALKLLLHDPTAPTFDDMQLTLSLFGGSLVFSASAVPAAFPKTIAPITSVVVDSSTVILGLDPTKSSQTPLSTTTQALLRYLGIARTLPFVLNLTLDCTKSLGQRNAIWFSPCSSYATTFRSVWTVSPDSGLADLNTFLGKFGLGIQIAAAEVIAVKKVTWDRAQPQYQDSSVTLGLTVTINGTDLSGYMELNEFSTSLQVICDNGPSVADLVDWVVKPFANQPPAGSAVKGWVEQIGKNIKPRRLAVTLDGTNNDALTHCEVTFEVDMTIGQPSGAPGTVASLFSFAWSAGSGMSLSGNFMPTRTHKAAEVPAPLPFDPVILPSYEDYLFLQPDAPDAVDSIALLYLIPGLSIVDNPSTIEVAITAASFTLSKTEVNFTAVLSTDDSALAASNEPAVPHLRLGLLLLAATWSKTAGLILSCDLQITLSGKTGDADSRESMLIGSLVYTNTPASRRRLARNGLHLEADSTSSWLVSAHIQDLNVGTLYELFDGDSQDGVLSLIGHIDIASLDLVYNYSGGKATDFVFSGILLIDVFELALKYEYPASGKWQFHANLSIQSPQPGETMTLGQLVTHLQSGESAIALPGFVGNIVLSGDNVDLDILVQNTALASNPTVFVVVDLKIDAFQVLFVQFQEKGDPNPKRLFRAAVTGIPQVNGVPIIDHIAQPFDEMYFLYASVGAGSAIQGISKAELDIITNLLPADAAPLVVKSMSAKPQDTDILITPGAHFVIGMTVNNIPTAILDYAFDADKPAEEVAATSPAAGDPTDNGSGKAALKKTLGPLTLDSIGLSYQDGSLGILLDATFKLGPIMLTLIGFRLAVPLTGNNVINGVLTPEVSINGLALSFNQPPTSAAGMFEQLSDALYAGGLTATFAPYALSAAGAYGTVTDADGNTFKTVAVFAQCQGPIIELEFAQVSGVVLGFGYNLHLTLPTVDNVTQFPLVGTNTTPSGTAIDIFDNLQHQSPVWVVPQEASDWVAAGLSMTALATLAVNAVVVIEFDPSVKLGIYADAVATFPNKASEKNFVYVELGIAGTVDFAAGSMLVQAKLAPSSYILDPSCHLTGGFGLGYWFGSSMHAGDFVFTLGGFHPAYAPPAHYPVPDRLAISWSLDGCLSITGASYAAVTPKAVMAGGMLLAALSLGPLSASFSAWADFLLNWEPFFFEGDGGVSVHVEFTLDLWIVTIHIDVEIGANLYIHGPSTAGTVHVDFWVFGFDIDFGSSGDKPQNPMLLNDFYTHILLQQGGSGPQGTNQHTVTCTNGLVPDTRGQAQTVPAAPWKVRGGVFAFVVKSVFPFTLATIDDGGQAPAPGDTVNPVLSKPMWRTTSQPLDSTVKVSVFQQSTKETIPRFQARESIAQLPTAIWGDYTQATDPIFSGNQISSLLNGDDPTRPLMNGLTILAPKPNHSEDPIPAFNVLVSNQDNVNAGTTYNQYNVPHCDGPWAPKNAVDPKSQYELVVSTWTQPAWGAGVAQKAVEMWATLWAGAGETPPVMVGSPPKGLFADNAAVFDFDYLVPPLVSV